jgi:hypothetical protein
MLENHVPNGRLLGRFTHGGENGEQTGFLLSLMKVTIVYAECMHDRFRVLYVEFGTGLCQPQHTLQNVRNPQNDLMFMCQSLDATADMRFSSPLSFA